MCTVVLQCKQANQYDTSNRQLHICTFMIAELHTVRKGLRIKGTLSTQKRDQNKVKSQLT
jgi:hypothetical protein